MPSATCGGTISRGRTELFGAPISNSGTTVHSAATLNAFWSWGARGRPRPTNRIRPASPVVAALRHQLARDLRLGAPMTPAQPASLSRSPARRTGRRGKETRSVILRRRIAAQTAIVRLPVAADIQCDPPNPIPRLHATSSPTGGPACHTPPPTPRAGRGSRRRGPSPHA